MEGSCPSPQPRNPRRPRPPETYHTDVFMKDDPTPIRTTVTASPYHAAEFIKEIARETHEEGLMVGIDTEWRECRDRNGRRCYKVAVLQLCIGRRCLVFQIYRASGCPRELVYLLSDPDVRFFGVGVDGDVTRLAMDYNLTVTNAVDLRHAAAEALGRPELASVGLKALALTVMGARVEKPKHVTMSNWALRALTKEQVAYACIDAYVSYEIGRLLLLSGKSTSPALPQQAQAHREQLASVD
ncbi:Werner Syndrome-like exonuclease [Oryza brachyantha]|uniref:3'-5' exonuclease domain-containing protein n=1 Tax=Oryza brachyantha TaxID=4533 RepID=J3L2J7_ORYBR|nr:Werner Syndrome-like exonuclease [Oryza brachyantha]